MPEKRCVIVDAHCDVITALETEKRELGQRSVKGHVDLPRLKEGGVNVQFFAVYVSQPAKSVTARTLELIDLFYAELEKNAQDIMLVKNFSDIQTALFNNKVAALLAIEGGEALNGNIGVLRAFYRLGVRCLTLTWNYRNEIGDGVLEERTKGGLTGFGIQVVKEMNRLNMLIDVSHLSEAGFWDVLETSRTPVIASHSNARKVCNHARNLCDDQIKSLADSGGVMGLCFFPDFVHESNPSLDSLIDHVDHIVKVAGTECIGLGSDFDGFAGGLAGLEDVSRLPALVKRLKERGYDPETVEKFLGGNFLRLLKSL